MGDSALSREILDAKVFESWPIPSDGFNQRGSGRIGDRTERWNEHSDSPPITNRVYSVVDFLNDDAKNLSMSSLLV